MYTPILDLELHPFIESVAFLIRQHRSGLPDLSLFEQDKAVDLIKGSFEGEGFSIQNEFHQSRGLRKLHLELANFGGGLQVLHCVFFPDPRYDLPIFGVDVVSGPAGISAAVLDLSPVTGDLPLDVDLKLQSIRRPPFTQKRELPEWGVVFSEHVHFIRPVGKKEEELFLELVENYLQIFISSLTSIVSDEASSPLTIDRCRGQIRYCLHQRRNDKTRNVLAKVFSPHWADRYIKEVLFDEPAIC